MKRRIGVLPQEFNALEKLTVRENVALFAGMYDNSMDPDELIALLDLEDKAKIRFDELSGGLKQRVGIAAALVNDPELVFLDGTFRHKRNTQFIFLHAWRSRPNPVRSGMDNSHYRSHRSV